jgi:hypothetical protein
MGAKMGVRSGGPNITTVRPTLAQEIIFLHCRVGDMSIHCRWGDMRMRCGFVSGRLILYLGGDFRASRDAGHLAHRHGHQAQP